MRPLLRPLGLLALAFLASAAAAGSPFRLGSDPVLGGGEYSTGGGITVAVELRDWNGRTGLCGVWAESEQLTVFLRHKGKEVLAKGSIALGREVLTHNLNFLRQVAPRSDYAAVPAGCVVLDRAWQPADAAKPLSVRLPRREFRFGGVGRGNGGPRFTFRDKGRVNPAMGAGSLLPRSWTSFDLVPTPSE